MIKQLKWASPRETAAAASPDVQAKAAGAVLCVEGAGDAARNGYYKEDGAPAPLPLADESVEIRHPAEENGPHTSPYLSGGCAARGYCLWQDWRARGGFSLRVRMAPAMRACPYAEAKFRRYRRNYETF